MATTGDLHDGPFWVQAGLLALVTMLYGLPFFVGIPMALVLTYITRIFSAWFAARFIGGLHSAGNIKYQHQFSIQESMIARGRFDEAAESFRAHLTAHPDDIPARYRLATLHLRDRQDPVAAEEELLALRRRPLDAGTALIVSNHLIDIYRAGDQRGKLMAELTRMTREQAGTPLGDGAVKLLDELRRAR